MDTGSVRFINLGFLTWWTKDLLVRSTLSCFTIHVSYMPTERNTFKRIFKVQHSFTLWRRLTSIRVVIVDGRPYPREKKEKGEFSGDLHLR